MPLTRHVGIADEIVELDNEILVVYLDDIREQYGANEVTLYDHMNSIIASSSIDSTELPEALPLADIGDLDIDKPYLKLVEDPVYGLAIQIVILVQSLDATEPAKTLQAQYPFTDRLNELTVGVQEAYDRYKELALLRDPLENQLHDGAVDHLVVERAVGNLACFCRCAQTGSTHQ